MQHANPPDTALDTHKLHITGFSDFYAKTKKVGILTLPELQTRILSASAPTKDKLPWVKLASFGKEPMPPDPATGKSSGCLRWDGNVTGFDGIELDYDGKVNKVGIDEAIEIIKRMGTRCLIYTSPSHTPAAPRWRLLIPLSAPEARLYMRAKFVARVNGFFGGIFGTESFTLSQSYYYGRALDNPDAEHRCEVLDGKFIDLQDELYKHEAEGAPARDKKQGAEFNFFEAYADAHRSGRGFENILAELGDGPELGGFHDVLCAAVASYVVANSDNLNRQELKKILCEAIDKAPKNNTAQRAKDIRRYKTDKFLDALIKSAEDKFVSQPRNPTVPPGLRSALSVDTEELNLKHAVLPIGGKTRVVTFGELEEFPGRQTIIMTQTLQDFALLKNKYRHKTVDKKGEPVYVPIGTYWLQSAGRRQYDGGYAFLPMHDKQVVGDRLNLWNGYGVKPLKPDGKSGAAGCSLFLKFMCDVICGGNQQHFDYLLKREATILQKRIRTEIALGLRTEEEGVGKGFYEFVMRHLLGNHAMAVSNPKHVIGAFNPHLETLLRLTADEALFVGNHEHRNALFNLITEPKLTIEPKGCGVYPADNFLNPTIISNSKHFIPVSNTARRFFIPTLSIEHMQDFAYFTAIKNQLYDEGGFEALLYHFLKEVDLTDFNVRAVPKTAGLTEQAALGRRGIEGLVEEVCSTGSVPCEHFAWPGHSITSGHDEGFGLYAYIDKHRDRELSQLGGLKVIKQLIKDWDCKATGPRRERGSNDRTSCLQWPTLAELRDKFEQRFGSQAWLHPERTEWSTGGTNVFSEAARRQGWR
jgi:hypothetical protein